MQYLACKCPEWALMSDLLLALHLALYISLTDKIVLLRQCFCTLVFFCFSLSNKDNYKTLERFLQRLTFIFFVILYIKFIHYKWILISAFKTIELAFSEDHIAAVRMLCLPAPSKVNTFSLRCLSVTHWYIVFRPLLFLG